MDLFEQELGFRPVGMWPSEQAVSLAMVEPRPMSASSGWFRMKRFSSNRPTSTGNMDEDASNLATLDQTGAEVEK